MPIPLLLAFRILQYGWYFYVAEGTSGAASNVAKRLSVGECWSGTDVRTLAEKQVSYLTTVTKTPAALTTATLGTTQVALTITSDANIIDFLPMPDDGIVTRTGTTRLEHLISSGPCL